MEMPGSGGSLKRGAAATSRGARRRFLWWLGALGILAVGVGGAFQFGRMADTELREDLLFHASTIARTINVETAEALSFTAADRDNPHFQRLRAQMTAYAEAVGLRSLYSMAWRDGRIVFGPESLAEDDPYASPPGTVYEKPSAADLEFFQTGRSVAIGPQTDEYGTFISALAPVLDPQTGELRLAIGVDMEATAWRVAVNRARLGPLLFALLLLATLLVGQTLLGRRERFPAERQGWLRHVEAALAAAVGLELSLAATWLARDAELRLRQNNFQALARAQSSIVMEGFRNLRGRLNTLGRFFESSAYVDRREFQNYAEPLARDGLCQGWGWVPSVAAPAVADVEAEAQRDGLTDFSIWQDNAEGARIPATGHERYFPMFYVTPVPKLEKMLGFDMGSEPVRRAALDEARRAGQATATDPVTLFALPDQPKGIVVFQAVASRRYKGFVVASVRLDALVELALLRSGGREAANAVDLFQLEPDGKTCPLTSFPSNHVCGYPSWTPGAGISFPLFAFGKTFGLIIHPLPGWLAAHPMRGQWLVALAGLVLTGMLTVFIGFLTRRRAVLEKEVQARTAELQTKSDELGRFFSSALDLLCITDTDGYVRRLNSEWEKMLGYPQNELIGHAAMDFIHPEDHRATLKALSSLRRGRPILSLTIRCRRKDGSYRWIEWKAVSSGPLVYASARDITERRQVEEHLRFQALLLDCVSESVVATNLEGRILYWSRGAEKVYGYTAEEVMNKPYRDFGGTIEPVDRAAFKRELLARGSWRGEHVQRKRDGTTFWTTTYISVVLDSAGRPCGFIGIDLDITERKRSEEALRASEERFEQVAESAGEWIWERDSEGLFTYSSPVVEQILGYKPEELVGKKHFYDLLAPNVREKIKKAAAERTLRKEAFRKFANPVVHQDGHVVILETTGTPILDREGRMVGYRGVNTDITERRRAEEALRTSEERFEQVAESAGEWIWEMDAEGLYTYSNPVVEEILGYKPEELVGKKHFYELFTPEVREEIKQEALGRTLRKEAFRKLANPVVRKDGRVVILETTGLPILDREGRLIGYRGADTDITERRRAEEALRTLSSRQQALLAAIPDIIMEVDTRKIYTWANRAGYDFFGEEVIGKEAVFYFEGEQEIYRAVQSLFNGEESVIYVESWQRRRDGQKRLLAWWCRVIKDENGEVVGALSTARDITEQRTLEEQLRQAQKIEAVGRLAGGVAHDFNNMLSVILGHVEMAMEQSTPEQPIQEDLLEIQKAAQRSATLTRQLLAFARKQTVSPRMLDLNETMSGMLKMLRRLIGEGIELVWKPGADLWPVRMDPVQVDQLLANLAVNARDAIADIGTLTVETENVTLDETFCKAHTEANPGEYVLLEVSDTGAGMDRATLEYIFEPFFTTKDIGQGTGLGLATVYGIMQQNDGFITVDSRPGQGSVFRLYLPRASGLEWAEPEAEIKKTRQGTETVLLVEDFSPLVRLCKNILDRSGYQVLSAGMPREALAVARRHKGPIHLLITDVIMPEMNGRELANQIQALRPEMKILYMSGYSGELISGRGVLGQGIHFLQKPFSVEALTGKVRAVLEE